MGKNLRIWHRIKLKRKEAVRNQTMISEIWSKQLRDKGSVQNQGKEWGQHRGREREFFSQRTDSRGETIEKHSNNPFSDILVNNLFLLHQFVNNISSS